MAVRRHCWEKANIKWLQMAWKSSREQVLRTNLHSEVYGSGTATVLLRTIWSHSMTSDGLKVVSRAGNAKCGHIRPGHIFQPTLLHPSPLFTTTFIRAHFAENRRGQDTGIFKFSNMGPKFRFFTFWNKGPTYSRYRFPWIFKYGARMQVFLKFPIIRGQEAQDADLFEFSNKGPECSFS